MIRQAVTNFSTTEPLPEVFQSQDQISTTDLWWGWLPIQISAPQLMKQRMWYVFVYVLMYIKYPLLLVEKYNQWAMAGILVCGVYYLVCGMVYIKYPLLLVEKTNQWAMTGILVCGVYYPVCGIVYIKYPLLLVEKTNQWAMTGILVCGMYYPVHGTVYIKDPFLLPDMVREGRNALFNDTSNTFCWVILALDIWLRTTYWDRNPMPPLHGIFFSTDSKGSFIFTIQYAQ